MDSWKADQRSKVRRKKIQRREMLGKSRTAVFFQWFVGREGRKGSLKRRVRRHVVRADIKNGTPLWREARFQAEMLKNWRPRTTFWSSGVEKLYAALARSTFSSQNVQTTACAGDFLKLRCRKIALRCGEKRVSKSNKTPVFWCFFAGFYVAKVSDRRDT